MSKTIARYGATSGAIMAAAVLLHMVLLPPETGNAWGMVIGYLTMLVALSMVFVGVKRFRDVEQGGVIRFRTAFGIGLAISAIATLAYILAWELYLWQSGSAFMDQYITKTIDDMRAAGKPAAEIAREQAKWAAFAEQYRQPLFRMAITATEIAPVGFLVSLVTAAILSRRPRIT